MVFVGYNGGVDVSLSTKHVQDMVISRGKMMINHHILGRPMGQLVVFHFLVWSCGSSPQPLHLERGKRWWINDYLGAPIEKLCACSSVTPRTLGFYMVLTCFDRRKFRSQTSDNMQRWNSRGGKSQRGKVKKWEDKRWRKSGERRCRCAKR